MEQQPAQEQARMQQPGEPDHHSPVDPADRSLSVVTFTSTSPPPPYQAAAPADIIRIPERQLGATLELAQAVLADGQNWTVLTGHFGEELQRSVERVSVSAAAEIVRRTILGRLTGGGVPHLQF
ncbi:hypothetical protein PG991_006631 [Apiospora marii]|uniref:Uncharacterized protein n=1 Tax=Apiospora marii TaxID=335849 RepID=A0ABR1S0Y6_9PEZI